MSTTQQVTPERMRHVANVYERLAKQFDDSDDNEVVVLLRAGAEAMERAEPREMGPGIASIGHTEDGQVVVDYGQTGPWQWVRFTPEQAEQFASTVLRKAALARAARGETELAGDDAVLRHVTTAASLLEGVDPNELTDRAVASVLSIAVQDLHAACDARRREAQQMPFQQRVDEWLLACFGAAIARDHTERSHRFLEEALETVQATGTTLSEAHQLVDYVYGRPPGELPQEIGGTLVTLVALCAAHGVDMAQCGEAELERVWTKVEAIRAKQAAKPKHSPLPEDTGPPGAQSRQALLTELMVLVSDPHRLWPDARARLTAILNAELASASEEKAATPDYRDILRDVLAEGALVLSTPLLYRVRDAMRAAAMDDNGGKTARQASAEVQP